MVLIRQNRRHLKMRIPIAAVVAFMLMPLGALAQPGGGILPPVGPTQTFEMRTVVKDFVTTEWTLECPDGGVLDMSNVALTETGRQQLLQCPGQKYCLSVLHLVLRACQNWVGHFY